MQQNYAAICNLNALINIDPNHYQNKKNSKNKTIKKKKWLIN